MRCSLKLLILAATAGVLVYLWNSEHGPSREQPHRAIARATSQSAGTRDTAQTWGNPTSLPDHFARHGGEVGARSADEYARMAAGFLQRAKAEGLPAKVDDRGVLRVFDPRSGLFGAYNRDGTTKTFFKPGDRAYFERQPGRSINLRTGR